MKSIRPFLLFCSILHLNCLFAQPGDSLSKYKEFFQLQSGSYQQWLDQTGIGQTLRVVEATVPDDSLVILYLGFHTENTDTVQAQWDKLKADYQIINTGATLENELFNKMTWYLEVSPKQGEIRLFDTYNVNQPYHFYIKICFQNDSIKTLQKIYKNVTKTISVQANDLSNSGKKVSVATFKRRFDQKNVFDRLIPYLRNRYERQNCDMRHPSFQLHRANEELHFVVTDLCKEVLYDESNPWWCEILKSWACESCKNCIKREKLDVHIRYEENNDGFHLKLDISAAYGSGWYDKPRDNGYHNLEFDYPHYLKQYADRLSGEIFDFLTKP